MVSIKMVKTLEGLQTIESVQKKLGIRKSTAIKYVYLMKKQGFVKTSGGGKQKRFYRISAVQPKNLGNPSMHDIINKFSKVKLRAEHSRIIGRKLSTEEALVRAIESKDFRTILAALALFNHIKDWSRVYQFAKEKNVRKKLGALYDVARKTIKTRKIDRRIYLRLLLAKEKNRNIVEGLKSRDYSDIEKKWGVNVPFNKADLWRYKE